MYKLNIVFFKVISSCSVTTVHLLGSWVPWQKNSTVIPSCAVKITRNTFAAEDGIYTGYLPGDDDDDSAFDSELEQTWRDFSNI